MSANTTNQPSTPNAVERQRATRQREERAMCRAMARVNVAVSNTPQRPQGPVTFQTPNLGPPPGLGPPRSVPQRPREHETNPEQVPLPATPGNTVPSDAGTETVEQEMFGGSAESRQNEPIAAPFGQSAESASQYGTPERPTVGQEWPDHNTTLRELDERTEQARQEVEQLADTTARIDATSMMNFLFNKLRNEHPDRLRTFANPQEWLYAQIPEYMRAYNQAGNAQSPRGRETRPNTNTTAPRMNPAGGPRFFSPVRGEEASVEDPFEHEDSEATRTPTEDRQNGLDVDMWTQIFAPQQPGEDEETFNGCRFLQAEIMEPYRGARAQLALRLHRLARGKEREGSSADHEVDQQARRWAEERVAHQYQNDEDFNRSQQESERDVPRPQARRGTYPLGSVPSPTVAGVELVDDQILLVGQALSGRAREWYDREMSSPRRGRIYTTLEQLLGELYKRFINVANVHEPTKKYESLHFTQTGGVKQYADDIEHWSEQMVNRPSPYEVNKKFLRGISKEMAKHLLLYKSMSAELTSWELLVDAALEYESGEQFDTSRYNA
ncbi:hypothetical protein PENSPDRAFT_694992 [Peniophora sp. CONT]|nr:hypothetical protein PENSPDRAFT_694992 [Peniophora sp. CONT]